MRRLNLVSFTFLLLAVACGGGDKSVSSNPTVPPSTSSDLGTVIPDERVTIQAAAAGNVVAVVEDATLPLVSAGTIMVGPSTQTIMFARTADGQYYGLSDAAGTYLVNPTDILRVSANSNQTGWDVPGYTSRAIGVPDTAGVVVLPRTCNKDVSAWNVHMKDGRILWFDHTSERQWIRLGIPSTLRADGLVEYGSYTTPTVSAKPGAVVNGQVTAEVTIDFQNNCLGGFGQSGKLTDLDPAATPIMFLWNSDKVGWGIDRTPAAEAVRPSYDASAGSYRATFTGLACTDVGNITVYKGSGSETDPIWDPSADGYGAGWFIIQNASDPFQFWKPASDLGTGVSVTFDRIQFQIAYSVPCTPPPGDTTLPKVTITGLTAGSILSGSQTSCAEASDNVGVVGVRFKLDDVNLGNEVMTSPYCVTWDTSSAIPGSHTLTATARDAAGNTATSSVAFYTGVRSDTLTWEAPPIWEYDVLEYRIYYGTQPGPRSGGTMISVPTGTLTTKVSGLNWNTTYYYVATAIYAPGESAPSNEASKRK